MAGNSGATGSRALMIKKFSGSTPRRKAKRSRSGAKVDNTTFAGRTRGPGGPHIHQDTKPLFDFKKPMNGRLPNGAPTHSGPYPGHTPHIRPKRK